MGLCLLPLIKSTRENLDGTTKIPFYDKTYDDMNFISYAWHYLKFGLGCILNLTSVSQFDGNEEEYRIYTNEGECSNSWLYIFGYTISLFVI